MRLLQTLFYRNAYNDLAIATLQLESDDPDKRNDRTVPCWFGNFFYCGYTLCFCSGGNLKVTRREFLKTIVRLSVVLGTGLPWNLSRARASTTAFQKTLLNLILDGGPDFRHLLVPPYSSDPSSYGYAYWSHHFRAHAVSELSSSWETRWQEDYTPV